MPYSEDAGMESHYNLAIIAILVLIGYLIVGIFLYNYVDFAIKMESDVEGNAVYNEYHVQIRVLRDGSLNITEVMDVELNAWKGEFRFGYRIIPISGFDHIRDFRAFQVVNGSLKELNAELIDAFGKVGMKFYFVKPIISGNVTFIINYIVVNAIWADGNKNYLKWKIFPEQHPYIRRGSLKIIVPRPLDVYVEVHPDHYSSRISIEHYPNETVIIGDVGALGETDTISMIVSFEKFIEPEFSLRKSLSSSNLLYVIPLVLFAGALIVSVHVYRKNKRKEEVFPERVISELDPMEFSYLKNEDIDQLAVLAGILDLGSKRVLRISFDNGRMRVYEWEPDKVASLSPWTQALYEEMKNMRLIDGKGSIGTEELLMLSLALLPYEDRIESELISKGYLREVHPCAGKIRALSQILIPLEIMGIALHAYGISAAYIAFFVIGLLLLIPLIILFLVPMKTALGLGAVDAVKEKVKSLLYEIRDTLKTEKPDYRLLNTFFGKFLPYAMAFAPTIIPMMREEFEHIPPVIWYPYYYYVREETLQVPTLDIGSFINSLTSFVEATLSAISHGGAVGEGAVGGGGFGGGGTSGFG